MTPRPLALVSGAALVALALTGCVANSPGGAATAGATVVTVDGNADA